MRWLIFLSRVSFIAGIAMILALLTLTGNFGSNDSVASGILTAGYGLAVVAIPLVCFLYLITFILRKQPQRSVPKWLMAGNLLFFTILVVYTLFK